MTKNLFRGLDQKSQKMIIGNLIKNTEGCYIVSTRKGKKFHPIIPETIGQFTGFVDCNAHWIFEGDIVEFGNKQGVVNFDYGSFRIRHEVKEKGEWKEINSTMESIISLIPIEVIGNVHEICSFLKKDEEEDLVDYYINANANYGRYTEYGWLAPFPINKENPKKWRLSEFESDEDWYSLILDFFDR